jgi:hypothetical protein
MEYDEVSLVDSGANQDAHVVLFKRDTSVKKGAVKKKEGGMGQIVKRKVTRTCSDCGSNLGDESKCHNCGSTKVKKSLIILRKEEVDVEEGNLTDEELQEQLDATASDEGDGDDGTEEEVVEEEDDETGEDDEPGKPDEDNSDPERDKHLSDIPDEVVGKASEETLDLTFALSKSIGEILRNSEIDKADAYEQVMVQFNTALDQAAERWFAGSFVSKSATASPERLARLTEMHTQLSSIIGKKEGGTVTGLSDDVRKGLSDDVLAYISDLEAKVPTDVTKNEDDEIFKGLSPAAVELVKSAQKTAEDAKAELAKREDAEKTREYITKAAGFSHLPIKADEFGPILKSAAATLTEEEFGKLEQVLSAANYNLAQSNVFKSFGSSRNGADGSVISKVEAEAKTLVDAGTFPTIEQAQAHLMRTNPSLYDQAVAEGGK